MPLNVCEAGLAPTQPAPALADEHFGDPATTSLRLPGQGALLRARPEVYLHGPHLASGSQPVTELATSVRVGSCRKDVRVVGDRAWTRGVGLKPSAPAPFVRMPRVYQRAFGGSAATKARGWRAGAAQLHRPGAAMPAAGDLVCNNCGKSIGEPSHKHFPGMSEARDLVLKVKSGETVRTYPSKCGTTDAKNNFTGVTGDVSHALQPECVPKESCATRKRV